MNQAGPCCNGVCPIKEATCEPTWTLRWGGEAARNYIHTSYHRARLYQSLSNLRSSMSNIRCIYSYVYHVALDVKDSHRRHRPGARTLQLQLYLKAAKEFRHVIVSLPHAEPEKQSNSHLTTHLTGPIVIVLAKKGATGA